MTKSSIPTRRQIRIALAVTAALLFLIVYWAASLPKSRWADFSVFYSSGLTLRHGGASHLYDAGEQTRAEDQAGALKTRTGFMVNAYPPVNALLFLPLSFMTYRAAYLIWGAINVFLWIFFQDRLRPYAPVPSLIFRYFMLCSLFLPLWLALIEGQTTLILLVAYSLAFVSMKRGEDFKAGAYLGLGLLKFHIVLPFAFICLLRGKWKLIAGFASVGALLGGLSLLLVGPQGVLSYVKLLVALARGPIEPALSDRPWGGFDAFWNMPTLRGMFSVVLAGRMGMHSISFVAAIASALLILYTAWRWRQDDRRNQGASFNLMFAAALAITLVTALHLYVYDLTLMILAVLAVLASPQWSMKSIWRSALTGVIVVLYTFPLYFLLISRDRLYLLAIALLTFAFATLGLAGSQANAPGAKLPGRPAPFSAAAAETKPVAVTALR
jgi:Glycosyltransferase family 87